MAASTTQLVDLHDLNVVGDASGRINPNATDNIERGRPSTTEALPPVDRGREAWIFLAACWGLEAIAWGLPFSFGIFQTYYQNHPLFSSSHSAIAAIGTTAIGVSYFSSPFVGIALQRYPRTRRFSMLVGLAIMTFALVGASYCSTASALVVTQGALYGLGTILLYYPSNLFIDDWFVSREGLAYGIMFSGTGIAGVGVPFVIQKLLDVYGFRTALRIYSVATVVLTLPCIHFIRPRTPPTQASALRRRGLGFVAKRPFWIFQAGNIFQSLGVFIPSLWMPAFAMTLKLPSYAGPTSLALYNGAYSMGNIVGGFLADRLHATTVILISTIGALLGSFVFWGLASNQAMLYIFAILWGSCSGMYNASWSGCAKIIAKEEESRRIDTGIYIGMMAAGKGIGGVVSGPLSERLLAIDWSSSADFVYGTSYATLVIFCGVTAAFGGSACIGRLLKMV